jgi:hypothetical protein
MSFKFIHNGKDNDFGNYTYLLFNNFHYLCENKNIDMRTFVSFAILCLLTIAGIAQNNAFVFYTERYQPIPLTVRGYGAGAGVTAAGVFGDILRTVSFNMER